MMCAMRKHTAMLFALTVRHPRIFWIPLRGTPESCGVFAFWHPPPQRAYPNASPKRMSTARNILGRVISSSRPATILMAIWHR